MGESVARLLGIMAKLRDPEEGCPWDCKQTFSSIIPHTIEETYEVVDCVEREDYVNLKEELGDLLFQVVFLSRIAEEQGLFDFSDVVSELSDKLVRRHPHVFADMDIGSDAELAQVWEATKQQEKALKKQSQPDRDESVLDDVETAHPALIHALKLQKAAAKFGFDWPDVPSVIDKVFEEVAELQEELPAETKNDKQIEHELGDLLFTCVNLSRHVKVNPETSLRKANYRFERRFRYMESRLEVMRRADIAFTINDMELFWREAKAQLG